jgi:flagella basal body P-ring formation protein FlgA
LPSAAQLTTNVYWWWIKGRRKPEQALRVVVAAKDLSAGSTLRHGDVGLTMRKVGELPDHFCCPHFARILPGHKIHSDFKRGEPIDLEETELWTKSRESQQQNCRAK